MKNITSKLIALGLIGALAVVSFTACSKAKETTADTVVEKMSGDKRVGGWSVPQDTKITEEELKIFNKAIEGLTGVGYVPVAYLGSQVVAGTNHAFLCQGTVVVPDAVPSWKIVYLYQDLQGNVSVLDIEDFDFGALCSYGAEK